MKIRDRIHIVASGASGFALTDPGDCTVYLLEGEGGCILIDSGCGMNCGLILQEIEAAGWKAADVRAILLTHGHGDHGGGAAELSRLCGAPVYGLSETARFVSEGDEKALSVDAARSAGIYGPDFHLAPCPVTAVMDGETLAVAGIEITALRGEGHCAGHCCYYAELGSERVLFSGDSVFAGGKISLQAIWDCDLQKYLETCRMIHRRKPDVLLPGHGVFLLHQGYLAAQKAVENIEKLALPDQH